MSRVSHQIVNQEQNGIKDWYKESDYWLRELQYRESLGRIINNVDAAFLNLRRYPACLTIRQVAAVLGRNEDQIRALIAGKLLKPLGNPARSSVKMFATVEILALCQNREWLDQVQLYIGQHHANKALDQKA